MLTIGNSVALVALLSWPLVVVVLFRALSPERALIWSILGAYMVLPELSAINLPGIPAFDKNTIPNLAAFIGCLAVLGRFPRLMPASWPGRVLLVMLALSPSATVLANLDPVRFGVLQFGSLEVLMSEGVVRTELPGLRLYDSASALMRQLLILLPFFLAREVLNSEAALREILIALVIAGALYALPMLFEVRFSPQLHTMLYGFFQHDFLQAMRAGGFRPFVFMPHGLWVAFFALMCLLAALALTRMAPPDRRSRMVWASLFMLALLLLCKSFGPIALAFVFAPLILFVPARHQVTLGAMIAVVVIAYPLLRGSGLVPTQALVDRVAEVSADRAQSLQYRFDNEDRVLDHAADKPLLGWGGWGRFMPHDPVTGESRVVVDGMWIITIGQYGWLGYLALFGLLTLPLFALWWQARKPHAPPVPMAVAAVAVILAANLLDLLPNATLVPFTWLLAGALLGYAEALGRDAEAARLEALRARRNAVLGRVDAPAEPGRRTVL